MVCLHTLLQFEKHNARASHHSLHVTVKCLHPNHTGVGALWLHQHLCGFANYLRRSCWLTNSGIFLETIVNSFFNGRLSLNVGTLSHCHCIQDMIPGQGWHGFHSHYNIDLTSSCIWMEPSFTHGLKPCSIRILCYSMSINGVKLQNINYAVCAWREREQ